VGVSFLRPDVCVVVGETAAHSGRAVQLAFHVAARPILLMAYLRPCGAWAAMSYLPSATAMRRVFPSRRGRALFISASLRTAWKHGRPVWGGHPYRISLCVSVCSAGVG
ncbi:unnamed protein product, partial [Amoebophrya sp. A120]